MKTDKVKLFDTMESKKVEFKPVNDKKVGLYACGLTVYNKPHIGNWSSYISWDILIRNLRSQGYEVNHVQNITDVGHLTDDEDQGDDKLQKEADMQRKTAWEIAEHYIEVAKQGRKLLNITEPTHSPRATDYIAEQIALVKTLESKGYTYVIENDGLYMDTSKVKDYGKLAKLDVAGLKSGARVANVGKRNLTDFALWKFTPKGAKRDMEWDSPWGKGFPGWHLECSAMASNLLGDTLDIHTGGIDHIPVHHTNEIAQSESASGKKFANYWLHSNHMKVDGTKMSKSLGNVYTLDDISKRNFDMRAFRILVLTSHYRTESNFTWKLMNAAQSRLKRWQAMADLRWQVNESAKDLSNIIDNSSKNFLVALNDDLDTPTALRVLEDTFNAFESGGLRSNNKSEFESLLKIIDQRLGVNLFYPDIPSGVKELIATREKARSEKRFSDADTLRSEIENSGYRLNDSTGLATWSRL